MGINLFEIVDAWITSINPTKEQIELARKRTIICNTCPHKIETIQGVKLAVICGKCGCPLAKKVFSKDQNPCPLKKWNF